MTELDAGQAYRRLQQRARSERRGTEELLVLYAHEGFLRRLSMSTYRDRLVLKGGMLLAALDARRPTRDADLSVHGVRRCSTTGTSRCSATPSSSSSRRRSPR